MVQRTDHDGIMIKFCMDAFFLKPDFKHGILPAGASVAHTGTTFY